MAIRHYASQEELKPILEASGQDLARSTRASSWPT
jgi:hypothetical protein